MTTNAVGAPVSAPQAAASPQAQDAATAAAWAAYYAANPQALSMQPQQMLQAVAGPMQIVPQAAPPMVSVPGVTVATDRDFQAPMLSVTSKAKVGKSRSIITSLVDWPRPGMHPLVIAVDDSGPLSCLDVGYYPHRLRLREEDYPGMTFDHMLRMSLGKLHQSLGALRQLYGSIVVDCGSTLASRLHTCAQKLPKNANNPRMEAPFFELGVWYRQTTQLIRDLGLPNIWLSWVTDGFVEPANREERKPAKSIPGGPDIMGSKLRNFYSGLPAHNFYMEKRKVGAGVRDPETNQIGDADGNVRVLHSKPYDNIDAGGRLQRFLPAVCPAHMGWVLSQITGIGPYAPTGQR